MISRLAPDRDHLGGLLDGVGELLHVAVELDGQLVVVAGPLLGDDLGALAGHRLGDAGDRGFRLLPLADEEAQPQPPFLLPGVEGEPGRVRAAVLAAVEHVDQGLTRAQQLSLVHDSGDSTHALLLLVTAFPLSLRCRPAAR